LDDVCADGGGEVAFELDGVADKGRGRGGGGGLGIAEEEGEGGICVGCED
jgi:hypothetical protein